MQNQKLPIIPNNMHCTFKYEPNDEEIEKFSKKLLGKKVNLQVVGYGSDGKNSGFEIALDEEQELVYTNTKIIEENDVIEEEYTIPHITVSMSENAQAIDTGLLDFKPLDEPFEITGVGGFFVIDTNSHIGKVTFDDNTKFQHDIGD